MRFRKLGKTNLLVSEIGFGAWAIGGGAMIGETAIGWGDADDTISLKAIHAALDEGINFFDTADIYGLGHSESLLGKTIGKNKEVIIATKGGNVARNNEFTVDYSKEYLISACEASLRRLKRDTIDYYQLHTARVQHLKDNECLGAMDLLQKQGKIQFWGLSLPTFNPSPEAEYMLNKNTGFGFQLVLNLINQGALESIKQAGEKGYGIIARMPLQFGLLTGKFTATTRFPLNDHRNKRLSKEVLEKSATALEPVWKLCDKYQVTKTQLALSYVSSHAEVSTIICGMRTMQHVKENTTGVLKLNEEDMRLIEEYGKDKFIELMKVIQAQG